MNPPAPLHPVSALIHLQFLNFTISIGTNSLRLAAKLEQYFQEYLTTSIGRAPDARLHAIVGAPSYDPSRLEVWTRASTPNRVPKESYYDDEGVRHVVKNRTGVAITLGGGLTSITGPLNDHPNQVVNLVGTLFGLSLVDAGYVMVHASGIVATKDGTAYIFLGNSGSGKSSLALQLIERGGYDFLSNDRVLLKCTEAGVLAVGLPKKPRVNPGTLLASNSLSRLVPRPRRRAYELLPPDELWGLEEKTDVDVQRELGARSRLSAHLSGAWSLEWRRGDSGLREEILDVESAVAAMAATRKDFGPYDLRVGAGADVAEFRRIAERTTFTRVVGHANPKGFAASWAPAGTATGPPA